MANTVIQLKKSGTTSAVPSSLANGELAINYADGKIFYKHSNGTILSFSSGSGGGDSFGTINANGTLVVAGTSGDVLNLIAGNNITFGVDAVNDKITINGDVSAPFAAANAAFLTANSSFANGNTNFTVLQVASNVANNGWLQANTSRTHANAAFLAANSAFATANAALSNTSGVTFAGDLTITGNVGIGTAQTSLYRLQVLGDFAANTKSFLIAHPTKDGMQLRYGSLEGPENGVYIRGKSYSNTIELPDYWTGLVHEDSITANITPFGRQQNLYVWRIANNVVYVEGSENMSYYYTVWAERKDTDKIIVEF
jgi:hypothetical protein